MPSDLRVASLEMVNFRCFERREFRFRGAFNVIIGENGSGKSAILDALSLWQRHFAFGATELADDDVRRVTIEAKAGPHVEKVAPCSVRIVGDPHFSLLLRRGLTGSPWVESDQGVAMSMAAPSCRARASRTSPRR